MANPSILITQCLQKDFIAPIGNGEALPNLLHIGHDESQRLLGLNGEGPIGQIINWGQGQPADKIEFIHIRDWHNDADENQRSHLDQFGPHCLANTEGAEFIFTYTPGKNTHIISSTTLNDFDDTQLSGILSRYKGQPIRIGIVGVWTEAKVLFLAYELATRYPGFHLAVCSALTASSSRSQHFYALEQLNRIVGVEVIDSLGEFVEFLGGKIEDSLPNSFSTSLEISSNENVRLSVLDEQLLRYLFRECKSINLKILDGGFSGNLVAGVTSIDLHGQEQAPHVIKIGPRTEMARERTAFEKIESVLGNNAPAISDYADLEDKGAIKYRYASMGSNTTTTFQSAYMNGASIESLSSNLANVFETQLGRFYRAAVNDKLDLFKYYCFESKWANSVRNKIVDLIGECPETEKFLLPHNRYCSNLFNFYNSEFDCLPKVIGDYPQSFVHGDLNGANIIIDEKDNVWLIDFFHTHRGHVLKDFAKLENDLLYILTPCNSKSELEQAYCFIDFLLDTDQPLNSKRELPDVFSGTSFSRAYHLICQIRSLASQYISRESPNQTLQWLIPQLRYAVHTIGFDEPNRLQRILALYTSCTLTDKIKLEIEKDFGG